MDAPGVGAGGEDVQPPPALRRSGCVCFVMQGFVDMKLGERVAHSVTEGHFYGEEALSGAGDPCT